MDDSLLNKDLKEALYALLKMAESNCINEIPPKIALIKLYNTESPYEQIPGERKYKIDKLINRDFIEESQVREDIIKMIKAGYYISWIDLTLFYVLRDISVILVTLHYSTTPTEIKYHLGIQTTLGDNGEGKIDVNEFVDTITHPSLYGETNE